MPRKYNRKPKPKRATRKRVPRGIMSKNRPLPFSGLPRQQTVRLRYHTVATLLQTVPGVPVWISMRANGPFDPEVALGGHQPYGYDTWSKLYDTVECTRSTIKVIFSNGTSQSIATMCGVQLSDTNNFVIAGGSLNSLIESGSVKYQTMSAYQTVNSRPTRASFSAKRWFNAGDVRDRTDMIAPITGLPTREAVYNVWCASANFAGQGNAQCDITVDYYCTFATPKNQIEDTFTQDVDSDTVSVRGGVSVLPPTSGRTSGNFQNGNGITASMRRNN